MASISNQSVQVDPYSWDYQDKAEKAPQGCEICGCGVRWRLPLWQPSEPNLDYYDKRSGWIAQNRHEPLPPLYLRLIILSIESPESRWHFVVYTFGYVPRNMADKLISFEGQDPTSRSPFGMLTSIDCRVPGRVESLFRVARDIYFVSFAQKEESKTALFR